MHSAHKADFPPQAPSLATLPFDVQSAIARHADLDYIARLRTTCRTLSNLTLYLSIPDFCILQAVTASDVSAFRQALSASDVTAKPPSLPSEANLLRYRRRRKLLQTCIWHLVCTHNKHSPVWWAPLDLLYDVTKVYLRELDHLDKTNGMGNISFIWRPSSFSNARWPSPWTAGTR